MKKILNFSIAALVAMGTILSACTREEVAEPEQELEQEQVIEDNIVTVTTTIGLGENDATKALDIDYGAKTLTKTFAVGEQVALSYENTSGKFVKAESQALEAKDIAAGGKSAKLTFTMVNAKADQNVKFYYPASLVSISEDGVMSLNIDTQDGTLDGIESLDYAFNTGYMSETVLPSVTLENKFAIVAFTLLDATGANDITGTITGMTISDGVNNNITVTRPAAAGPIYVVMRPIADKPLTITATGGGKNYTKTLTGKTWDANNFYQQGLKMAEAYKLLSAATAEDIGKVVCADGHLHPAKTAVPAGCTAVGILGKVTETGIGLILALQDATSQDWNTINGWTSVTTYAGTTLKVLPDDAAHGSLTSYTTLGTTAVSDWAVAQKSDYEAIFTNLGSTTNSNGMTYDANVNAYITTGVGGTALDDACSYWSATGFDGGNALAFNSYFWGYSEKTNSLSVRPVLGFGPAKLLSAATTSDIGKVVCADGHLRDAKTAVPAGGTAVGILGKVTETGHGLILALQDATAQECYTINDWTSVTTYAGTTLMVLPDDTARGSLASYTTLGETTVSNWAVAQKSDYEEIFVNLGSTTGNKTYDDNVNAYITTGVGGTALSGYYWSATEYVDVDAWGFSSGKWDYDYKALRHSVRPVLGF